MNVNIEKQVLGYDCDGNELFEFDIVRIPFYNDINFDIEEYNPRQYCVVKTQSGTPYLISIYDWWEKDSINRYEKRNLNEEVPISVLKIEESINFEKAYSNDNWLNYDLDREKLVKKLNTYLKKN